MVLSQMADANDSDAKTFQRSGPPWLATPAVLPLLLNRQEVEQSKHLGAEVAMRLEDGGCLLGRHPGAEDETVGLVQRGDRLGAQVVPLQTDHVDAADFRGVSLDQHV